MAKVLVWRYISSVQTGEADRTWLSRNWKDEGGWGYNDEKGVPLKAIMYYSC